MRRGSYGKSKGFTLVELVTVIILISLISALGVGLFTRSSTFSPLLATQQLESATLLAQQAALAGNSSNSLTISQTTNDFQFQAGGRSFTISREGASITYRRADQTSYQTIGVSGLTIGFDSFGRVSSPVAMMEYQFLISGDSDYQVCLSPLGAIYRGGC